MTYSMLKNIMAGCFLIVAGAAFYKVYDNQYRLYTQVNKLDEALQYALKETAQSTRVVEKISSSRPWGDIQKNINDAVIRIISHTSEVNLLEPYRTPRQSAGVGSGYFISEEGEIITNHHVVDEAVAICIKIPSLGKAMIDVEVVGTCPDRDIALLKVKKEGLAFIKNALGKIPVLSFGDSDLIHRSDEIMILGYPLGSVQIALKSSTGVVSGREHVMGRYLIQTTAAINPGNSGGPALNEYGEVIGMACAGVMGAQNLGYVIPSNEIKMILDDLRKGGLLRRPFLGILHNNGNDELLRYLRNPEPGGCYVVDVYQGSPLAKAGVKTGDMIYEINGHPVDLYGDLKVPWCEDKISIVDYVSRLEIGQRVTVVLYRKGKRVDINFTFNFSELLPVHQIFPGYDTIDYEIFGGMVIQKLTINHIPLLVISAQSLIKYTEFENEKKPVLVVTHIIPNSQVDRLEMFRPGFTIKEVNGHAVSTLDELRTAVKNGVSQSLMTFKCSDDAFFVLSVDKALKDENMLSKTYEYPLSPFMQEILTIHNKADSGK